MAKWRGARLVTQGSLTGKVGKEGDVAVFFW